MLRNYMLVAWRNLKKHQLYAFINILGLAMGIVACWLIGLYISDELAYDQFHERANRIFRIAWIDENPQTRTPHPMTYNLTKDFPEVEKAVSLSPLWGPGLTRPQLPVQYEDKFFDEGGFFSADTSFFDIFSFKTLAGSPSEALKMPWGMVITRDIAQKYFGNEDPIGKVMTVRGNRDFTVGAVIENIPNQSHFHFDFLISYLTLKPLEIGNYYQWTDFGHYNYLLLSPNTNSAELEAKLNIWSKNYIDWSEGDMESFQAGLQGFKLQPLTDIHLYSHLRWELGINSHISYIYMLGFAALFILLIACINFMNLSTARSMERAREVGLRKSIGAMRGQIFGQFLAESALNVLLAVCLAVVSVDLLLPFFSQISGKQLEFDLIGHFEIWLGIILTVLLIILMAGSYPAIYLSAFQPIKVLQGRLHLNPRGANFRRFLVVLQFGLSALLISGTFIIFQQINYLQQAHLGFDRTHVMVIPLKDNRNRANYQSFKTEVLQHTNIVGATAASNVPGGRFNRHTFYWENPENMVSLAELNVDQDFFEVMDISVQEGRKFSLDFPVDPAKSVMLNETASKQFEWENPIGQQIAFWDADSFRHFTVVGIFNDFNFQSMHHQIAPLVFGNQESEFNYVLVKLMGNKLRESIAYIEQSWQAFDPNRPFEYSFLEDDMAQLYQAEERMGHVIGTFSSIAILVACLGLLGLITFMAEKRKKEIGIRKVLGASIKDIIALLTLDLSKLIIFSLVLALPISWILAKNWLQAFAYQVSISPAVFIFTILILILLAFITLMYSVYKAANQDPVESLKYE